MEVGDVTQATNNAVAEPNNQFGTEMFLTLLITQLRTQNPMEPLNANEFVNQLVQFNTLEQLIGIREAVEQNSDAQSAATPATGQANQQ